MSLPIASITVTRIDTSLPVAVIRVAAGVGSVRYDAAQTLTSDQKAQARTNLGVTSFTKTADRITFDDGTFIFLNQAP